MTPRLIPAGNPGAFTGRGNNTYLIGTVLIDAGVGQSAHLDALAAALGDQPLEHLVITHGHSDHAGGVPALRERWPTARVSRHCPDGDVPDQCHHLADGDRVEIGSRALRVLVTPGHAADHICLFDEVMGDLFTGDMVIAGTTVLVPSRAKGGSMRAYLQSLARLRDLDAGRLLPGHGPVIEQPRHRITAVIAHRLEREAQVAGCLKQGVTDPAAIVAKLYDGVPAMLLPFAEQTVIAHIEKLEEDQR